MTAAARPRCVMTRGSPGIADPLEDFGRVLPEITHRNNVDQLSHSAPPVGTFKCTTNCITKQDIPGDSFDFFLTAG